MIKIAIVQDHQDWHQKFIEYFELNNHQSKYSVELITLDTHDFLNIARKFDVFIWNPAYMGIRLSSYYKEKVYYLEKFLGKLIFPSYDTVWHFESKIAQTYLFSHANVRTPDTFISSNYDDAKKVINKIDFPIVLKKSDGAGGRNVRLIESKKWLEYYIQRIFCHQLWYEYRKNHGRFEIIKNKIGKPWFWSFLISLFDISDDGMGVIYLQEFLPNNNKDLRIVIIGEKYGYGFWRKNRPGDFRASGSHIIDYDIQVPISALEYCRGLNQKFGFDTMAYDLLEKDGEFVITEMSYSYPSNQGLYNAPGYYFFGKQLEFITGHTWPQHLWVKALLEKMYKQEYI